MNLRDIELRPRPHPQPSTICVPGHGNAVACHQGLVHAMARTVIQEHT